jgi:glycosyltransferase involved in cell wall biosynthesis
VDADLAVDQVLIGWFGVFALEMMALGKPVVAYIRPDLQGAAPDLPVVSADPQSLAHTLRSLLLSPERREDLSRRGPLYVRAHHDPDAYCSRILRLYHDIGAR